MPSVSFRRRRKQRIKERHTASRRLEFQQESVKNGKCEEIAGLQGQEAENSIAAKKRTSVNTYPETILAPSLSYAERTNLTTVPIWRSPGPCTPSQTYSLFPGEKKKETLGNPAMDIKNSTASHTTTVYIPPHLRNPCNLASNSLRRTPEVEPLPTVLSRNATEAAEDFSNSDLLAIFQETIDHVSKNYDNFDPQTNYIATGNFGLVDFTRRLPGHETLVNSNALKTDDRISNSGALHRHSDIIEMGFGSKTGHISKSKQAQEKYDDWKLNWNDLMAKLLSENKLSLNSKPGIYVYPVRMVNFAHVRIQFAIKAFNIPDEINLTRDMIESVAKSPSGILLSCYVTNDTDKSSCSKPMMEYFRGHFTAIEETGLYHLKVRFSLPLTKYRQTFGVLVDESDILVSKNYFHESEMKLSSLLHLKLAANENVFKNGCGSNPAFASKPWGLGCAKTTNRLFHTDSGGQATCLDPETSRNIFNFDQRQYNLNRPTRTALDETHRRVFVCDNIHHRNCFYPTIGHFLGTFGGRGSTSGIFRFPWDINVSPRRTHVAVSDTRNNCIQLFDMFGNYMGQQYLDYHLGISFGHNSQSIYPSDFNTMNILQVPFSMQNCQRLNSERLFLSPQGLLVDNTRYIHVTDNRNYCVNQMAFNGAHFSTVSRIGGFRLQCTANLAMM